jgi:hypothetical protein
MAFFRGPNVVTNGLVLALDAANPKSYMSGSTTWNDLSGNNNNGTLTNGPTFSSANGGSIVFDGVNDYINVPSITWTPTAFTVNWFTFGNTRGSNNNQVIGASNGWGAFQFHSESQGSIYVGIDVGTRLAPGTIPNDTYVLNVYQNFTFTYGSGIGSFFKNGILIASKSMTTPAAWTGFYIGDNGTNTINGLIPLTQIYNRALSASEVLQNYNALKSRFNLT